MQDILLFMQHHTTLFTILAILLIVLVIIEIIQTKKNAYRISPAQVTQLINHHKACVIDVRDADAFLAGHIVGAISLPLSEIKPKSKKLEKFKNNPIVIVCNTGGESQKAALLLAAHYPRVQILAGGMRAWRETQMPVIKG